MSQEKGCTMDLIKDGGVGYSIYCHAETGVMYLMHGGGVCTMVDADGKPLIYGSDTTENKQQEV